MTRFLMIAFLALAAGPAKAQVGVGLSPDSLGLGRPQRRAARIPPVAAALDRVFGPEAWTAVQISTAGPAAEMAQLSRDGYYKRELIELVLIAAAARRPLSSVLEKRRKEEPLSLIAGGFGLDYESLHEEALAVEEIMDREYLPRYENQRPEWAR